MRVTLQRIASATSLIYAWQGSLAPSSSSSRLALPQDGIFLAVRAVCGGRAWLRAGGGNILLIPAKSQQIRAVLYSFDYNRHILWRTRRAADVAIPSSSRFSSHVFM